MEQSKQTRADQQHRRATAERVSRPSAAAAFADNRVAAMAQRKLADAIDGSPQAAAQGVLSDGIHGSPAGIAQRRQIGSMFGEAAQRNGGAHPAGMFAAQLMGDFEKTHIFKGHRNKKLSGLHSVADLSGAELKPSGSKTDIGDGAYEQPVVDAKYEAGEPDYKTKASPGTSTFWPDAMSAAEIEEAGDNAQGQDLKVNKPGNPWHGKKIACKGKGAFPVT